MQCSWFGNNENLGSNISCLNVPFWTFFGAFLSSCQNITMPFISKYGGGHNVLIIRAITLPFVGILSVIFEDDKTF